MFPNLDFFPSHSDWRLVLVGVKQLLRGIFFLFLNNHGDAILGVQDAGVMSREWNVGFLSTSYVFWSNSVVEIVCQDKLVLFL